MTLGIITDCTHFIDFSGKVGTENHILLRQLQQLASHFKKTIIACPFGKYDTSKVVTVYNNLSIEFQQLPLVGGDTIRDKVKLISALPKWIKAFKYLHQNSDVVYQRFPNNLNIPGFLYFWLKRKKVFATYTGTWNGYNGEPLSFKLQRWILKNSFTGPVWVYNDKQPNDPKIKTGFSPSYSLAEWEEEAEQVATRIEYLKSNQLPIYRFITVGTLIDYKNQLAIVKACKALKEKGFPFHLTVVGDGPMKQQIQTYIQQHDLAAHVFLVGKKNHITLRQLYRTHDFIIQAPLKEGFGKVPVEGFFHGVIPIINNVSMATSMVGNGSRGFLFDASNETDLVETILALPGKNSQLASMIKNAREYARSQTLEIWAEEYFSTISSYYSEA